MFEFKKLDDIKPFIIRAERHNIFAHPKYKRVFNCSNGVMIREGDKEDAIMSPMPEILDLEISAGYCKNGCPWCYKGNSSNKDVINMTFDIFKNIFDKISLNLDSVAFGITGVQTNPDFIKMMKYCRENKVVPNFTLSGIDLTDELAEEIVKYVGGLAVSVYPSDKNIGYNTIKKFIDLGIKQTNMHLLVCKENLSFVYEVLNDIQNDKRLEKLNACIFLGLKPKGRAENNYHVVEIEDYRKLIDYCFDKNIRIGFDSCSATKFEKVVMDSDRFDENQKKKLIEMSEPCESGLFSAYINVEGRFFPCSFCEDIEESIDVVNDCEDFYRDVWMNEKVIKWREKLLANKRKCPVYKLD